MREMSNDCCNNQMGVLARAVDEHGKRFWRENEADFREGARRSGYVAAVIANFVALYVFNNLLAWNVPFLTGSFVAPLAVLNLSLMATVAGNVLFLVFDPKWFRRLAQLGLNVLSLAAMYTLLIVFPFDFGGTGWESLVRIALIVTMVGIAIGSVVGFCQLIFSWHHE